MHGRRQGGATDDGMAPKGLQLHAQLFMQNLVRKWILRGISSL